jgi:3-oxoacyl-[acyl-carrier-protein] synthase II
VRRVVISGIGLIGPTGIGLDPFWSALIEGRSAIDRITRFDATHYPCQVGGEVRDLTYEAVLDPRTLRNTTHATQLALAATHYAMQAARIPADGAAGPSAGVSLGTALGGAREAEQQHSILLERGLRRVNPFVANGTPNHATAAEVASALHAQGAQLTFSTGCAASLHAIAQGATLVASGELDVCVAGGTDSPLTPMVIAGMSRTQELSTLNDAPQRACCPFDRRHAGLVLSEGSCVTILEPLEAALRRGTVPWAEVRAGSSSCDANGLYAFDPTGETGARAIRSLLQGSGLAPSDVDYVCAHANSSPAFDRKEAAVLTRAFGDLVTRLPVSSIKAVLGHPFGASGAFQVATACLALRHELIPPTHNLEEPDPACALDCVAGAPRAAALRHVLVTNYGYGGINAYLMLSRL